MNFKKLLLILVFISSCTVYSTDETNQVNLNEISFKNKGFAIVYDDELYLKKLISKKINDRDLVIFQRNLKKNTPVLIKNLINGKTLIAKVGNNSHYPFFNNSVLSRRIAEEIELDEDEPYIEIVEILDNSSFVAKKAKTFDAEKNVADKAPIDSISINSLNEDKVKIKKTSKRKFKYIIKVADFYFEKTAKAMAKKLNDQTNADKIVVKQLSETNFRVFLGPFYNLNSLQNAFNSINILQFENLEIIKI
tara:strand:+ start:2029 stop:2778 length:750 start_codon:yes stop_codon:yes gene_type:complete